MSVQRVFLGILVIILLIIIGYSLLNTKWEKVEQEVGLSKEAIKDPFLAAGLFLEQHKVNYSKLDNKRDFLKIDKLTIPINATLLLDEAALTEYPTLSNALLKWIIDGGNLIYALSSKQRKTIHDSNLLIEETGISIINADEYFNRYKFSYGLRCHG